MMWSLWYLDRIPQDKILWDFVLWDSVDYSVIVKKPV